MKRVILNEDAAEFSRDEPAEQHSEWQRPLHLPLRRTHQQPVARRQVQCRVQATHQRTRCRGVGPPCRPRTLHTHEMKMNAKLLNDG